MRWSSWSAVASGGSTGRSGTPGQAAGANGYLGRFRLAGRKGTARAYVSDLRRVAVVDVGAKTIAISPEDKTSFLQEARNA